LKVPCNKTKATESAVTPIKPRLNRRKFRVSETDADALPERNMSAEEPYIIVNQVLEKVAPMRKPAQMHANKYKQEVGNTL
jgi:hypothetical protein